MFSYSGYTKMAFTEACPEQEWFGGGDGLSTLPGKQPRKCGLRGHHSRCRCREAGPLALRGQGWPLTAVLVPKSPEGNPTLYPLRLYIPSDFWASYHGFLSSSLPPWTAGIMGGISGGMQIPRVLTHAGVWSHSILTAALQGGEGGARPRSCS